ncbi:MAG: NAD(+)/NADH kinase [Fibrobacterales bacterium]
MKFNSIGVVAYSNDPLLGKALDTIVSWSKKQKNLRIMIQEHIEYSSDDVELTKDDDIREADVIISIGGDGTFLTAARIVAGKETPILGINLGTVGFLTDYPITFLEDALKDLKRKEFKVRDRIMLNLTIIDKDKILYSNYALNEVLLKPVKAQMNNLSVTIDDKHLTVYKADSLMISTPTGSTAYNLAAGGPIVYPKTQALIINPINPSSLTVRPMIIPADSVIMITEVMSEPLQLVMDGRVTFTMKKGCTIIIKKSKWCTRIVRSPQYGFMDALKDKLGWSGQPHIN